MTREDLEAALARTREGAALDTLRSVPTCVGVVLRREIGGRWWDISLAVTYWQSTGEDGQLSHLTCYWWEAEEPAFLLTDGACPDVELSAYVFDTPEAALADALAVLAVAPKDGG